MTGLVTIPGSKSEANRALLLAALSNGTSAVSGVPDSRDTDLMADALRSLGAEVLPGDPWTITPPEHFRGGAIDCGLAGTVMRFVPPVALLADASTQFHGDDRASERPMGPLCSALRQLGADVTGDALPFTVTPPREWNATPVEIDAGASSQFISGLLLAGARYPNGLDLRHVGDELPSRPHIDMTIAMLVPRGVEIAEPEPDHWIVTPSELMAGETAIDPDLTNAAAFVLAGVLTGGLVEIEGWPQQTNQPGAAILDIIKAFGGPFDLKACDVDLSEASELTPIVAALAAHADGTSHITGVGHIRGHETDRLQAISDGLRAIGVQVTIDRDGLTITGSTFRHGGLIDSRGDHRLVHMAALMGLTTPGVMVLDVEAVAKTMPDFTTRWEQVVAA